MLQLSGSEPLRSKVEAQPGRLPAALPKNLRVVAPFGALNRMRSGDFMWSEVVGATLLQRH